MVNNINLIDEQINTIIDTAINTIADELNIHYNNMSIEILDKNYPEYLIHYNDYDWIQFDYDILDLLKLCIDSNKRESTYNVHISSINDSLYNEYDDNVIILYIKIQT